ncbi:MAG: fused DSP-PTPase phosphatase/NAD kinase-like protein [Candidatus Puniceispirillaceae bacterium]
MTPPPSTGITDWAELMLKDHGVLRLAWHNLHQIDAQMWRSNQPTPGRVEQAAKAGIKTIINLRGPRNDGGWKLEAEACKKANITLIDFTARSRAAPDKEMLYGARDLFNSIEKPALMHCKSGADRAGLMAALYVLIHCKKPVAEAMKQLSLRYLHVRQAKTGMLDSFFETYAPYEAQGMAFFDWVDTIYDPKALHDEFMARPWAEKLVDGILRRE